MSPAGNSITVGEADNSLGAGVYGSNERGIGVWGVSYSNHAGVFGESSHGVGIRGKGHLAGLFEGNVEIHGNIQLGGDAVCKGDIRLADCAEEFNVAAAEIADAGTVMVLREDEILCPSNFAYDKRVIGIISGAGNYRPGLILDKDKAGTNRKPIGILGKVFCKVDADYEPIRAGDLLTTSNTLGHAMKATDPRKAFGAVIGKALRSLERGQRLIPVLIALQ